MSIRKHFFVIALILSWVGLSCSNTEKAAPTDKPGLGTLHISVDESFQPVLSDIIETYSALYPQAKIIASFKSESECLRDFFHDSSCRVAIVGRGLTEKEARGLSDTLKFRPGWRKLATDAIVLILPSSAPDSMFTIQDLKEMLSGKRKDWSLVFDGLKATSTYRYIQDSLLQGGLPDTSVVKAAKNTAAVIDFVSNSNGRVMGLVGISWIGNPEVPAQRELLKKIKIAYIQCQACEGTPFVKPMQESIMSGRYPLRRSMYYLIKENYTGLGTGFISFLKYEQGQLIFRRSYLRPEMELGVRNVQIQMQNDQKK